MTLDLQGFELSVESGGIASTGQNVTILNGRIVAQSGNAITVSGAGTLIERVRARTTYNTVVTLGGRGSTLSDSIITVGESGIAVRAGEDTIVRDNQITARFSPGVTTSSRTLVANNQVGGCVADPCMYVSGANSIIRGNTISPLPGQYGDGIWVEGDHNQILDNVLIGCPAGPALGVTGQWNTFRGNSVPSCGASVWETGIRFDRDGNYYGDNIVWAVVPFSVGATVQTDLGGNVGVNQ